MGTILDRGTTVLFVIEGRGSRPALLVLLSRSSIFMFVVVVGLDNLLFPPGEETR